MIFQSLRSSFRKDATRKLIKAALNGDQAEAERLVASGVDPNEIGRKDLSPLFYCLLVKKNPEACGVLVSVGADPNYLVYGLGTPLTIAASYKTPKFIEPMIENGADPNGQPAKHTSLSALRSAKEASYEDQREMLFWLLDNGADPNLNLGYDDSPSTVLTELICTEEYTTVHRIITEYGGKMPGGAMRILAIDGAKGRNKNPEWQRLVNTLQELGYELPKKESGWKHP